MKKNICLGISLVLNAILLYCLLSHKCEVKIRERIQCDTIVQTKIDTHIVYKPRLIESRVIDTIYVAQSSQDITLPVSSKHYQEQGIYDLWISGYKANLDSIKTYNKEVSAVIRKEVVQAIEKKKWDIYPYLGFRRFNGSNQPSIGVMLKSPKKWIIGGEFGLYSDNKAYYGFNLGYKITK